MNYTVEKMNHRLPVTKDGSTTYHNGFAFIDEAGHTFIIVYGEGNKNTMSKIL